MPEFDYAEVNRGRVRQSSWMAAYVGAVAGVGQINLGVQKARYRASIRNGETGAVDRTRSDPWLYNAALLVEAGAQVEGASFDGRTALMMAAMFNRVAIIDYLISKGADPKAKDANGITALDAARTMGAAETVAQLEKLLG